MPPPNMERRGCRRPEREKTPLEQGENRLPPTRERRGCRRPDREKTPPEQMLLAAVERVDAEKDMDGCVEMTKLMNKVASSRAVSTFPGNVAARNNLTMNRDELQSFCRTNVRTFYHYHGGCGVGSVVGQDYRVFGVEGLTIDKTNMLPSK
ncbi:(R)-mandelonitrile lyase 2 [Linum perenne]